MTDLPVPKAEAKPSYQDLIFELCKPLLAEALPMPPGQAIVTKLGRRIKAQVEVVFAAGRAQAPSDVRGYAESLRSTSWNPHTGVALGAVVDAAAVGMPCQASVSFVRALSRQRESVKGSEPE